MEWVRVWGSFQSHIFLLDKHSRELYFSVLPELKWTPTLEWVSTGSSTLNRLVDWSTPEVQHISLMECMASWGAPMSSTGIPRREDRMGPMVVPQGLSLRTITSWGHRNRVRRVMN